MNRIWSKDRFINKEQPKTFTIGQRLVAPGQSFVKGFRLSLFWSIYTSMGYVFEVAVDPIHFENAFWGPAQKTWKSSKFLGYRVVSDMQIVNLVGMLTPDHAENILTEMHDLNHNLRSTESMFLTQDEVNDKLIDSKKYIQLRMTKPFDYANQALERGKVAVHKYGWNKTEDCFQTYLRISVCQFMEGCKYIAKGDMNDIWKIYRERVNNLVLKTITT